MDLANVPNWHYYVYAVLFAFGALCTAVAANAVAVPPGLHDVAPYAGLVALFLGSLLPRIQTQTGPGAPPIISPPPKAQAFTSTDLPTR